MLAKSCRRCGVVSNGSICPTCKARYNADRERMRPSRQARGYDALYVRNRNTLVANVQRAICAGAIVECAICGKPLDVLSITAEHVVPVRDGGTSEMDNLVPAHSRCNTAWNRDR